MARQLRIEFAGAVYHVMSRGNRGEPIFSDDQDRQTFLKTLAQTCERTGWMLHAYVLMTNHYHLLIETPEPNLVAGMKWLQGTYTRRYNARHNVNGHLFQGRYRSLLVDNQDNSYLGIVSTYIHLNPARAGLVPAGKQTLRSYRWSSFPDYLKSPAERPSWLRADHVIGSVMRGPDEAGNRMGYEAYLETKVLELDSRVRREELEAQWKLIRRGWCLGEKGFKDRMLERAGRVINAHLNPSYAGPAREEHGEQGAESLLNAGIEALGLNRDVFPKLSKGAPEKRVLAWWLRRQTTVTRRWICDRLSMGDESSVTHSACEMEQTTNPRLLAWKQGLEKLKVPSGARRNESQSPDFLD